MELGARLRSRHLAAMLALADAQKNNYRAMPMTELAGYAARGFRGGMTRL